MHGLTNHFSLVISTTAVEQASARCQFVRRQPVLCVTYPEGSR
jgi:hypothetical protein